MADEQPVAQSPASDGDWITVNPHPQILDVVPQTPKPKATPDEGDWKTVGEDQHKDPDVLGRFFGSLWNAVNPVPAVQEWYHRPEQTKAALDALQVGLNARHRPMTPQEQQVFERGVNAIPSTPFPTIIPPFTEPVFGASGQALQGDYAGAAGTLTGAYGAPLVVGKGLQLGGKFLNRPFVKNVLNPVERASQEYLEQQTPPVETPLSMQTGSPPAQAFENLTGRLPGGGAYGEKMAATKQRVTGEIAPRELARIHPEPVTPEEAGTELRSQLASHLEDTRQNLAAQILPQAVTPEEAGTAVSTRLASDLERTRTDLAQQVSPTPASQESAGQGFIDRGSQLIQGFDKQANQGYQAAWQDVGSPRLIKEVPIARDATGGLVMGRVNMPVDVRWMKDIARQELPKLFYRPATEQSQSAAFSIYKRILEGPDYISADQAEEALKGFKAEAREAVSPELRTYSQGVSAGIVPRLQAGVDAAVAEAGPEALAGLRAGRAATAQKYGISDIFSKFGNPDPTKLEPVGVFRRMTWGGDAGINQLRAAAQIAPEQMPAVGRAFIDGGGNWSELGPQTKSILFRDPNVIGALDQHYADQQRFGPLTQMEPVALFRRLTQGGGAKINLLQDVAQAAPEQIPQVARAFIDSGGDWDALDPHSKNILLRGNQQLISSLDQHYADYTRLAPLTKLEPVQLFKRMTGGEYPTLLGDVAQVAPEQMPKLARAWMQGLLDTMTRKGDITNVESTLNTWLNTPDKVKALTIRDPGLVSDLNNLMFSMKRLAANPNPSGSGFLFAINQMKQSMFQGLGAIMGGVSGYGHGGAPGAGMGAAAGGIVGSGAEMATNAALARMLFNRKFTRLLSQGIQSELTGNKTAGRMSAAALLQMMRTPQETKDEGQ